MGAASRVRAWFVTSFSSVRLSEIWKSGGGRGTRFAAGTSGYWTSTLSTAATWTEASQFARMYFVYASSDARVMSNSVSVIV